MTSILDDSPVKKSSSKRDVIVEELPAGVLDSLSSVSHTDVPWLITALDTYAVPDTACMQSIGKIIAVCCYCIA